MQYSTHPVCSYRYSSNCQINFLMKTECIKLFHAYVSILTFLSSIPIIPFQVPLTSCEPHAPSIEGTKLKWLYIFLLLLSLNICYLNSSYTKVKFNAPDMYNKSFISLPRLSWLIKSCGSSLTNGRKDWFGKATSHSEPLKFNIFNSFKCQFFL